MKELEQLTEVVMSMHASIVDLQGKVLAQGAALEALCRTLPPQWQPQAARNLQESAEHLLELMDDEPTPPELRERLSLQVAALLEALGQPPGRPAGK